MSDSAKRKKGPMATGSSGIKQGNREIPLLFKSGSVLIGIIVVMLIFSALAAALLPMVSASYIGYAKSQTADKAYYLAESGLRFFMSRYENAGNDTARDLALENLNERTFQLRESQGSFRLKIFPFFFLVDSEISGSTSVNVRIPGNRRSQEWQPGTFPQSGRLKIGQDFYNYDGGVIFSDPSNIIFAVDQPINGVDKDSAVLLVAISADNDQTNIPNGGTLVLSSNTGDYFPSRNGQVLIDDNLYVYNENDRANDRLVGIRQVSEDGQALDTFTVRANTDIILTKYAVLESKGWHGPIGTETERTVTYYAALPSESATEIQKEIVETFSQGDLPATWETVWGGEGAHSIRDVGGNNALAVERTEAAKGHESASLIRFNWSQDEVNLNNARKYSGRYLSYDTQIKVGFDSIPLPDEGYGPESPPIPRYYAAGLTFRLDNNQNMYGLSFLRGDDDPDDPAAQFDLDIVPIPDTHLLVLWQSIADGMEKKWLAYKRLEPIFFFDNSEDNTAGWSIESNVLTQTWNRFDYGGQRQMVWNDSPGVLYDNNITTSLVSNPIAISGISSANLSFQIWHSISAGDLAYVEVSADGGPFQKIGPDYNGGANWHQTSIALNSVLPAEFIQIKFTLQTNNEGRNWGWMLDDIAVIGQLPVAEATLLARIREADILPFESGGPTPIKDGDWIATADNSGAARVFGSPIVSDSNWSDGNAQGRLMLQNLSGSFDPGDTLLVNNEVVASVAASNSRNNMIQVFYGQPQYDTPNAIPIDYASHANEKGDIPLYWPPEDIAKWQEKDDYFMLIQWDVVSIGLTHRAVPMVLDVDGTDTLLNNAIIQSSESELLTCSSGEDYTRPELGLHALGDGAENIYFDDFGLRFEIGRRIAEPIQQ